jgi:transcriptional regulator with XRE-family HTH domain
MANDGQTDAVRALGQALRRLRVSKGVSGQELARRTDFSFSQSTISRIENGQKTPIPEDVEALVVALGEGGESVRRYRAMAEALFGRGIGVAEDPVGRFQSQNRDYEERARHVRVFQPSLVPGLLQTREYARGVVGQYAALFEGKALSGPKTVNAAVLERLGRQAVLDDTSKRFTFLLTESVLETPTVAPIHMASQLSAIRDTVRRPNVTLLVIENGRSLPYPPMHAFQLFDDYRVLVETLTTSVSFTERDRNDLDLYASLFAAYAERATADVEPILARHQERWRSLGE